MTPARTAPDGFAGFGEDAIEFFDGLLADNSRAYWDDHRTTYDRHVRAPMLALLDALEPEFGPGKVFRPHRDLRFAKDKTPYKTHCGAIAGPFYVEVGPAGLMAAAGHYVMAPDQLARFRAAVDDPRRGTDLQARLADLATRGLDRAGETLRTRPRGVAPDHPRLELLRHRGLYAARTWAPDDVLHSAGTLRRVRTAWRGLRPLVEWLADHVGPSTLPRR